MVKMNGKAYMTRGKKLVSLCLQNDDYLKESDPIEKTTAAVKFSCVENQEQDLVQPEDYGFSSPFSIPHSSTIDNVDFDLFEDYSHNIFPCSNVANPVSDFNDDDYYIENSQDVVHYTELQRPKKKIKLNIPETKVANPISDFNNDDSCIENSQDVVHYTELQCPKKQNKTKHHINKPSITIPESPEKPINVALENAKTSTVKFPNSKEERVTKSREKHPMLVEDCGFKCHRDCKEFNIKNRTDIWNAYWKQNHDDQIKWLARYIHLQPVKTHTTKENEEEKFRKNESRTFYLPYTDGTVKQVCKKMFLNTFGYKNDSVVTTLSKKLKEDTTSSLSDKRGTHEKPKVDTTVIKNFINLYKPCTAHYRRHNTPNMKYLGQDITLQKLYEDFKEKYPEFKCCKEIIRRTLKDMHISLHRPQNDKCCVCLSFETSITENVKARKVPSLKLLCKKILHKNKAKEATDTYSYDANREKATDERIYSMDLQKSVLLPMMPEVKDCFFTNRMIGFNLTFCGLSKDSNEGSKCIVWHEATGGRDGKDMVDAIHKLILSERDVKHFTFWADNCCAQNKNWILFTALVTVVNLHEGIESITLKYLTKGHTHMSADGVHGNIEKNFRRVKNIYDFEDYKDCLQTSRKGNKVIEVIPVEKRCWEKKKKAQMTPVMLNELVEVKFMKKQRTILYKKAFHESSYSELDFLQKRYKLSQLPKNIQNVRGLRSSKKKEIMEKLVGLMPSNRRLFWEGLPENDSSVDLISGGQEEACS